MRDWEGDESEMTWCLLTTSWKTFTCSNLSWNDLEREGDLPCGLLYGLRKKMKSCGVFSSNSGKVDGMVVVGKLGGNVLWWCFGVCLPLFFFSASPLLDRNVREVGREREGPVVIREERDNYWHVGAIVCVLWTTQYYAWYKCPQCSASLSGLFGRTSQTRKCTKW